MRGSDEMALLVLSHDERSRRTSDGNLANVERLCGKADSFVARGCIRERVGFRGPFSRRSELARNIAALSKGRSSD